MKQKLIISTILFLSSFYCFSQFKDYENTVGFTCGGAGSSTPIVDRTYELLNLKDYEKIVAMLYSNNSAENFLGVLFCEKMNEKGILSLSEKDLNRISKLYKSNKTVEICGGCTFMGFVKLSTLLKNEDEDKTKDEANQWLEEVLEDKKNSR
jgi:hypothetical protein